MRIAVGSVLKMGLVALLALALVAFIACGGSSSGSDDDADGGSHEIAEHVEGDEHADDEHGDEGGDTVHVALEEWNITSAHGAEFEAGAGEVVFEVHNEGVAPHDLKLVKTDLAPDALPITDGVVDLEAAGEPIGGVDLIPGGEMQVATYDLEAGHYVLVCTVPGHYQQGMHAELTIQ